MTLVVRIANTTSFASAAFTPYDIALGITGGYPASCSLVGGLRYAIGILMVGMTVAPILSGVATPRAGTGIVLSRKMTTGGKPASRLPRRCVDELGQQQVLRLSDALRPRGR